MMKCTPVRILKWVACCVLLTLSSCHYAAYQTQMQTRPLPQGKWSAEQALSFDYFVDRARLPRTLYLYVRFSNEYDYTTLPLAVELRSASGWSATTSLSLALANQPGVWSGKGYALHQQLYKVNTLLTPPHPGLYTIQLRQASGQDVLRGIETIGIAWVLEGR